MHTPALEPDFDLETGQGHFLLGKSPKRTVDVPR